MIKHLPQKLSEAMSDCTEIVNLTKAKALIRQFFQYYAKKLDQTIKSLLFYSSVRWHSQGKVLARLYELQREVKLFLLNQNKHELYKHLKKNHWIAKLAYMTDVFGYMNELNKKC